MGACQGSETKTSSTPHLGPSPKIFCQGWHATDNFHQVFKIDFRCSASATWLPTNYTANLASVFISALRDVCSEGGDAVSGQRSITQRTSIHTAVRSADQNTLLPVDHDHLPAAVGLRCNEDLVAYFLKPSDRGPWNPAFDDGLAHALEDARLAIASCGSRPKSVTPVSTCVCPKG